MTREGLRKGRKTIFDCRFSLFDLNCITVKLKKD